MHTNLHRKLSISELAGAVCLSNTHLRRLFRTQTGTSLMRYLRQLRMERAKTLLETTFLSVKEVAARAGINNVSHFVRDFARVYGRPPTEHRAPRGKAKARRGRVRANDQNG